MKALLLALSVFFSLSVAAEFKHGTSCSTISKVCATYHPTGTLTTRQEGRFALELSGNDEQEVELLKVDLWMQMGNHGHGSAPLKVVQVAPGEFDVTNAHFVMRGLWQIRVTYQQGTVKETLIIPVQIKE